MVVNEIPECFSASFLQYPLRSACSAPPSPPLSLARLGSFSCFPLFPAPIIQNGFSANWSRLLAQPTPVHPLPLSHCTVLYDSLAQRARARASQAIGACQPKMALTTSQHKLEAILLWPLKHFTSTSTFSLFPLLGSGKGSSTAVA